MHDADINRWLSGEEQLELNKFAVPSSYQKTLGMRAVTSKNERVELAMQIMKYRRLIGRTTDEELLKRAEDKILEFEQKLREIDE